MVENKIMKEFKNMKFRISSEEEFYKIQMFLFREGYEWSWLSGRSYFCPKEEYIKFLYTSKEGILSWCDDESFFNGYYYPEYTLEELTTYELKEVEKEFEQFEVFDKLIELNKKKRIENAYNYLNVRSYIRDNCTVTFNCGRQKGHTSYIKSRFNPETDILIVMNYDMMIKDYYKIIENKNNIKLFKTNWMKGYNFSNVKNIWIDSYSILSTDEINEFYRNLAVCLKNNFDKNLTIIGVG